MATKKDMDFLMGMFAAGVITLLFTGASNLTVGFTLMVIAVTMYLSNVTVEHLWGE